MASVTSRFLKTFFLFSLLPMVFIFVIRLLFFDNFDDFGIYKPVAIFLSTLLTYTVYFPYVLSFSLHRAFFCYKEDVQNATRYISQKVIIITSILLILYTLMLAFSSSKILTNIYNIYLSERYTKLIESKDNKSKEFMKEARYAFSEKDYDKAINIIEEGLLILPGNNDLTLLLRDTREAKLKAQSLQKGNANYELEMEYMLIGIEEYSSAQYEEARQYFYKILDMNNENGLAKYYLNKISLELGENNNIFNEKDEDKVALYDRIAEGISFYEKEDYWQAYRVFREVYLKHPSNFEILDYYNLAISKVKINGFFIRDANFLYDTFVSDIRVDLNQNPIKNDGVFNKLAFPIDYSSISVLEFLKINDNDYLYSTVFNVFDEIYFFDTVLFSTTNTNNYKKYRFGKIVEDSDEKNKYKLILKGQYLDNGEYNNNDKDYNDSIILNIDPKIFNITKNISALEFVSISDVIVFLKYIPNFGYDKNEIIYLLMSKIFSPLIVILISAIISYYSIRYRAKKNLHPFHTIVGFFGCVFITFMLLKIFDLIIGAISIVSSGSYITFVGLGLLLLAAISIYSVQFFRVKIDD